ncbi:MAG: T9SS type A sorting domain-containing protein [bacterium]|nr:MAG: T9SS type A sorting domain-containing protein [bacterium]
MNFCYKSLVYVFLFITTLMLHAQIPNAGFEQWTAGNPDGWVTTNIIGLGTPITQVTPAHSGTSAVRGEVITTAFNDTIPPLLIGGNFGQGFPISNRYGSLTGFYKFSPSGGDVFIVVVLLYSNGSGIGEGAIYISAANSVFSQFTVPIDYYTTDVPDEAIIEITIVDTTGSIVAHPGSYFILDDLEFSLATDIQEGFASGVPVEFQLEQNFPNPFNPVTQIQYGLPHDSEVTLVIYNQLGQKIATLVEGRQTVGYHTVSFNAAQLPSGLYFYQIQAGSYRKVMRMMLLK